MELAFLLPWEELRGRWGGGNRRRTQDIGKRKYEEGRKGKRKKENADDEKQELHEMEGETGK